MGKINISERKNFLFSNKDLISYLDYFEGTEGHQVDKMIQPQ